MQTVNRNVERKIGALDPAITSREKFVAPWFLKSEVPGRVDLTQAWSDLDKQPVISFILTDIKDVYKNSTVSASAQPNSVAGAKAVITQKEVWTIDDNSDDCCCPSAAYPISGSVTLTMPRAIPFGDSTTQAVQSFLADLLGTAYDRLIDQLYGALDARDDVVTDI